MIFEFSFLKNQTRVANRYRNHRKKNRNSRLSQNNRNSFICFSFLQFLRHRTETQCKLKPDEFEVTSKQPRLGYCIRYKRKHLEYDLKYAAHIDKWKMYKYCIMFLVIFQMLPVKNYCSYGCCRNRK